MCLIENKTAVKQINKWNTQQNQIMMITVSDERFDIWWGEHKKYTYQTHVHNYCCNCSGRNGDNNQTTWMHTHVNWHVSLDL